jgi:hypothetical protein
MSQEIVRIELEKDQALVLLEWLTKQCNADSPIRIELIELFAMDCLQAKLYAELEEPFKPNYQAILSNARERLLEQTKKH